MNRFDSLQSPSGYTGSVDDWRAFLGCWERAIMDQLRQQPELYTHWEEQAKTRGSLRFPGASSAQIDELETRLNATLPKSYKDFLTVTNGWIQIGFDAEDALVFPADQVDWLGVRDRRLIDTWTGGSGGLSAADADYFRYGQDQDPVQMRDDYLESALMVSEAVDAGVYLLNPEVKSRDGEWEAWFFGWEVPGAVRFRSFANLMRHACYLATRQPERIFPYSAEQLRGTCADLLPVDPNE